MQRSFYDKLAQPFEKDEKKKQRLVKANSIITRVFYIVYPVLLIALVIMRDVRAVRVLLVPLISFAAVTLFRKICNAKRPYEVWDAPPLLPKDTKGNSFPSRHIFSVYMIAMAVGYIYWPGAIVIMVSGVFLAVVRVIARVHFVKDVAAGAAIAIVLGWIGFWMI